MKSLRWLNVTALANRLPICGVFLSLLLACNLHATEWQEVSRKFNLAIYIRHRPDSRIEEVRGIGEFHAPISVLKGVLAEGSWLLEPIGNQTRATYTLYTDGGGIPPLLMNFANKQSVSRLFDALHARMGDEK